MSLQSVNVGQGRSGLSLFARQGQKDFREKLKPGTRITISGWPAKDPQSRAFSGRSITFADGATMLFGSTPDEGDRWQCVPGPCPYTYPDVPSR